MFFSYTYMMTNFHHTVIYTGVTSNLVKRVYQHKTKAFKGFTSKYNCEKLVYFQEFSNISEAIDFEKKIKAGNRAKKEKLISEQNPKWKDLSDGWVFIV
ncbi:GIY-YIG nuclease family protein [Salinimicrobium sp. TH3]|uniref:GIY-YIG nuclease family protein n=1 Tax=Salinimicrobium sp. TH3 TaxID=2997342 RepID=UPI002274C726|nr:GIY-YIG nuclease family protein [Salinimicrobium sp. TH3]MCY2685750.1 GIY-YIG nuclease family protein [Salinimicrobium sp. TH3]